MGRPEDNRKRRRIRLSFPTPWLKGLTEWDVREEGTGREGGRSEQETEERSRLDAGLELLPSTS